MRLIYFAVVFVPVYMPGWRNGRRCGLKILPPASYLVIPSDTKQYLPTFQPLKQLTSCLVSLGNWLIFGSSMVMSPLLEN